MCAFKEEERSVLISVTNERNYRVQNCANYWHHDLYVSEGSNHVGQRLERKISFLNCVLVYLFTYLPSACLVFFPLTFFVIRIFSIRIFLSVFSHRHTPSAGIRSAFYRHPPPRVPILWRDTVTGEPHLDKVDQSDYRKITIQESSFSVSQFVFGQLIPPVICVIQLTWFISYCFSKH